MTDLIIASLNDELVDLVFLMNPFACAQFGIKRYEDKIFDLSASFALKMLTAFKTLKEKTKVFERENSKSFTKKQKDDVLFLNSAIDRNLLEIGQPGKVGFYLELSNKYTYIYEVFAVFLFFSSSNADYSHFFGPLSAIESIFAQQQLESSQDLQNYRTRLSLLPAQFDHMIDNYKSGIRRNATLNFVGITLLVKQCKQMYGSGLSFEEAAKKSGLNKPEEAANLVGERDFLVPVLSKEVLPGIKRVSDFLETVYIHHARKSDGVVDIPGAYEIGIELYTEVPYLPEEIHTIGLAEVERIEKLLEKSKIACGFNGPLKEFQGRLLDRNQNPSLYFNNREDIVPRCIEIIAESKLKMESIFTSFPNCQVKPVPDNLEASAALGQYESGTPTTGGTFTINLRLQIDKPTHQLKSLCLHEANPGHHHSISMVIEEGNQHLIRRLVLSGPYVEGWGLYSEFLGEEMGMFTSPLEYFGRLEMEMWRACRLVVDSGLHAKGWSIEQAVNYISSKVAMTHAEAVNEVNRYSAIYGQALSYKVGELKIKDLRLFAEKELAEYFNVKEFHDVTLGSGALPMAMLERVVKEWVLEKKEKVLGNNNKGDIILDITLPHEEPIVRKVYATRRWDVFSNLAILYLILILCKAVILDSF
ncbi:hypothetical protein HK100_012151 [Physocladia obscura]|uniref:DUF885 domain-containing protein n=1 Tax=Physocladia obscura TaxID=109957 RepID=A0AAD5TB14_9FUNG|nr:hypothetical protein HK100_012151 [Physocladia obscura]